MLLKNIRVPAGSFYDETSSDARQLLNTVSGGRIAEQTSDSYAHSSLAVAAFVHASEAFTPFMSDFRLEGKGPAKIDGAFVMEKGRFRAHNTFM